MLKRKAIIGLIFFILIYKSFGQGYKRNKHQAIPVAIVQGGTLSKSGARDGKKLPSDILCNEKQNCATSLIKQAKNDIEIRKQSLPTNVSESAYNASVAGAFEYNKETVLHNNTIHLIQNNTHRAEKDEREPMRSLDLLANKNLVNNKTISIAPNVNNETRTKPEAPLLITYQLNNKTNTSNKTISIDRNATPSQVNNNTHANDFINVTTSKPSIALPKTKDLVKRVQLVLPSHMTNVYLHWLSKRMKEHKKSMKEEHSIVIGPLDDLPDNPHGNGPQDKTTKDLEGSYTVHTNTAHKTSKHKKKARPKREIYNLDIVNGNKAPYASILGDDRDNRNYDYDTGIEERNLIQNGPTKTPAELASLYQFSAKPADISPRNDAWDSEYTIPEQYVPSQQRYDKFIEGEASDLDQGFSKMSKHFPVAPVLNAPTTSSVGVYKKSHPFSYDSAITPRLSNIDNTNFDNPYVLEHIPSLRAQPYEKTENTPYIDKLPNREFLPAPSPYQEYDEKRDVQIQNLLNRYDEQTKQIAKLYQLMMHRLYKVETNVEARSHEHYPDHENLIDPTSTMDQTEASDQNKYADSRNENNYFANLENNIENESPYYRDPVNAYQENRLKKQEEDEERVRQEIEQERAYENEKRDSFEGNREEHQKPYEETYQDNASQRDEVPGNEYTHNRLIEEFLKMFTRQNSIPNKEPANMRTQTAYQAMPQSINQNRYSPQERSYMQKANSFPVAYTPNEPSSSMFPPYVQPEYQGPLNTPQFDTSVFNQLAPTPQQAAFMTNMGTPPESQTYNTVNSEQPRDNIANQQGVFMLMVSSPSETGNDVSNTKEKKETVDHEELTRDGLKRVSSNVTDDDRDFSINLKKAADFVLNQAVKVGNISLIQRTEIEHKLNHLLDKQYKNKTRGQVRAQTRAEIPRVLNGKCEDTRPDCVQFKTGGVCPFMRTFMKGTCSKTCKECPKDQLEGITAAKLYDFILKKGTSASDLSVASLLQEVKGISRSPVPTKKILRATDFIGMKMPRDPVMYLSFENSSKEGMVPDMSANKNNAVLEKGATVSQRYLGTCGKAIELNDGSVAWSGDAFKRKPESAITIAMWVKVKKSGVINWFANGKKGDKTFYTKTKGTAVPAKVWTHVAGTFDSDTGLARIYINGDIEQEQVQRRGTKLAKNWLVNGIGSNFGDDSLHYVDEVVLYDRALTTSEIRMLYNRCMFNRMILHFGFQKGNKTNINDQSGLENNAILIGGASQKMNCDRCGACLDLTEGPDATMKIQQISVKNLPRVKLSIAVWVSLNTTHGVHNIFTTESSNGNIGYRLQVVNGRIRWAIGTDTVPVIFDNMTATEVVPAALWTHVLVSYNNENGLVKMYANGLLKFKDTVPVRKREYLPNNWENDASIGDKTLKGYIDEFILYNWEIDDSEALYVRNYCADHPKLVHFTVRVPLTKKTFVPKVESTKSSLSDWWNLYTKLAKRKQLLKATGNSIISEINKGNDFTLLKERKK